MIPRVLMTRLLTPVVWGARTSRMRVLRLMLAALVAVPSLVVAQTTTQVVEYYTTDAIGSVRAVTKQVNGQWHVVARHDFMPFGEEVLPQVPPQDKRLFTGKERDAETGQDYFEARFLRAGLGRFTTVDPLASSSHASNPQFWNRYTFGLNNPLRIGDPFGLEPTEYYDTNGKWLGTDGRDNGVFSLITNRTTAEVVQKQGDAGLVNPETIPASDHVDLAPLDRAMVGWVYDNTGTNSEAAAATGFYGQAPGLLGTATAVGSPAEPGQDAGVTLPNMTGMDPRLVAHGHPGASDRNGDPLFQQRPSETGSNSDLRGAVLGAVNVVVGKHSQQVYFFNSRGRYATVPIGKVTNLQR